ncbi:uncharacterized protein LOC110837461 [Zootermopsis nevadensis]|uniref:uncharacterized protein LOC110837461 n=1 Tax=Zootermopsis nevadensis TaxID=136037 RepID=UPI000B8E8B18|nr:uncharacterized protein LOC110837461 [Zootermopsis nevadensis]
MLHYQEAINKKYGYSRKDATSKTITLLSPSSFTVLPWYPTSNKNDKLTSSMEIKAKSHHIIHTKIIHSGTICNSTESRVPNVSVTVLKNLPDFVKSKQFLTIIQTGPHKYDRVQMEKHPYERELLFNLEINEFCMHRHAPYLNTWGAGESASNIYADHLQRAFVKADTAVISTMIKFLKNCNSAINSHHVHDTGSSTTYKMLCVSNSNMASASENHGEQSDYHISDLEEDKTVSKIDLSVTRQTKYLHASNILWYSLPVVLFNEEMPLYTDNISLFNTSYSWLEGEKSQVLETYNAICKNRHIQSACIANSISSCSNKHSSMLAECISFDDSSRKVSSVKIWEYSDDRKVINKNNEPFTSSVVLHEDDVTIESEASTSLEEHGLDTDGRELSDIEMQKKTMDADSVYHLRDFTRDSTDETGFGGHPIIKFHKLQSLSQPSLPTYWLDSSTDDEPDDGSDSLSETFTECEDIHQENIPKLLGAVTEVNKGKEDTETMPHDTLNAVPYETAEEETVLIDSNKNVHTIESGHLVINTKSNVNTCFNELCNKLHNFHSKNNLIFYEETKLLNSPSFDMNGGNNAHVVPFGTIRDSDIWYRENALELESEISQNINGNEDQVNERNEKQNPLLSLPNSEKIFSVDTIIPDGNAQFKVQILSDNANPQNRPKTKKTHTEERYYSHPILSACDSNYAHGENVQNKVCALTLPSNTNTSKSQVDVPTSQTHGAQEEIYDLTEANSKIHNRYKPHMKRGNISSPKYISAQKSQIFTRSVSPDDVCSSDVNQHLPGQNEQAVFYNSASKSVSDCWEVNNQTQQVSCPGIQNNYSHNQMAQVHNRHLEDTLHSCVDMAIKKYENDISCYTEAKPTRDVTVQTNIRSFSNLWNKNYCFLCFNNYNQFNNNGLKDGNHQNLALKRNIEALYLESVSVHKKARHTTRLGRINIPPSI